MLLFSRVSAKAERDLSNLYGVFLCVELGDPPSQDFMGPYQNATPILYDCRFDMTKKTPQSNCHGCIWSCYTSFTKGNFFQLQIWLDVVDPLAKILWVQTVMLHLLY